MSNDTNGARDNDPVNHPEHYTSHPSGIECIQIVEHMNFNLGNALKYIWRADLKGNATQDLQKAEFYIKRELLRIKRVAYRQFAANLAPLTPEQYREWDKA